KAERGGCDRVRAMAREFVPHLHLFQRGGVDDRNAARERELLDRGRSRSEAASRWTIGLGHHAADLVARAEQCCERARRELRGAGKKDSQGLNPASSRLSDLFLKFRLDSLLLEPRQVVDEDLPLEMVQLMLD